MKYKQVCPTIITLRTKTNLSDNNRLSDINKILISESIETSYHKLFHKSVLEYNKSKPKKAKCIDESYDGYLKTLTTRKGKTNEQREFIITLENCNHYNIDTGTLNKIFGDYLELFIGRNPNLYVYNAVIHHDESQPHMHINIIPIATGYTQGMLKRPSFTKWLDNNNLIFIYFLEIERSILIEIFHKHTKIKPKSYAPRMRYKYK